MVSKVAFVIFFLVFGINTFFPFPFAEIILGIDALVLGIAIACGA